ncbi:hypothetical protein JRQ81_008046 [Phrynocephalus forsythii]|uniref:Tissue factor n=1 Tax=Phrynocephalus forsythii TaxID=171643 RepID=A0A9Q0Y3Z6_9SAUR|nr:hypothetical protein JRQ81_008046 [Phrynocephalus forsythii]
MGLAVGPLAAFVLLSAAFGGEPGAGEPQAEVPKPIDVTIESYNFNTSVRWNYQSKSSKPLFVVEKCCYGIGSWIEVSNCVNISQHYCDLTHKIEQCSFFWVRVKALDGLHQSNYTASEKFTITRDGKIGPPKLNLSITNGEILVSIEHPRTPYHKKRPLSITANLTDFTYTVFLWKNGSREKECPRRVCTKHLPVPSWDASYCVSAQGISVAYDVIGEESNESCVSFPPKHSTDSTVLTIVGVVVSVVLVVVLIIVYVCLTKEKAKLPKFLASMARSRVAGTFDVTPESSYISVVTSSSYKPVLPECEDEKTAECIGFVTEDGIVDLGNRAKEVGAFGSQDSLSRAGEMMVEDAVAEIPAGEQKPQAYYSKSLSGQEEMCNNLPALELPPKVLESRRNIHGYDKPHWQDTHPAAESLIT